MTRDSGVRSSVSGHRLLDEEADGASQPRPSLMPVLHEHGEGTLGVPVGCSLTRCRAIRDLHV